MADDRRLLSAFCNAWPKGLAGAATANAIQNRTKLHETEELVRVISFEFEDRFSVVMGRLRHLWFGPVVNLATS